MHDADVSRGKVASQPNNARGLLAVPPGVIVWGVGALCALLALWWAVATGVLTWSMAVDAREAADAFVAAYPLIAYAGYVVLFVAMAMALVPVQLWIIAFSAILFGFWPAIILSWIAVMLGAVAVFMLARGLLAGAYRKTIDRYLGRVEAGFNKNQFSWLLTMRLLPFVPYAVGNVLAAVLGARLRPFVAATALGPSMSVFAYAIAGDRARAVLSADKPPDLGELAGNLAPAMIVFAAVPLITLLIRRWLDARRKA